MSKSKDEIRTTYQNVSELNAPKHMPDGSHNVAGYMHVAVPSDNSTYSFELQESYLRRYISEHPAWNLVKIYRDAGKDRSTFDHMIEECQRNHVDLILVKSLSRISRNLITCVETIRQFRKYGLGFYFINEDLYTLDPQSDNYVQLFEAMALEESRHKSAHICTHVPNHNRFETISENMHTPDKG